MVPQEENADKICRAPGHKLGSEFQVLQNSLKSGEDFPPMYLDESFFTFFLVSLWVHVTFWDIFLLLMMCAFPYGLLSNPRCPPHPPHAFPWHAVGEPCSSTHGWRWHVPLGQHWQALGSPPGWEGVWSHAPRYDGSAVSVVCSWYLQLLSQTLLKHRSFVGSLQPWWLQSSRGVWNPVLFS